MRLLCLLLTAGSVVSSPWWTPQAQAQPAYAPPAALLNPPSDPRIAPVNLTAVRPLEIEGTHASPLPEPSAGFALALLGSAFLVRRRRPHLN
jgi:MYXO-CTERM domain-containing protein